MYNIIIHVFYDIYDDVFCYVYYHILLHSELRVMLLVIYNSRKEILLLIIMLLISCLIFGPSVYFAEVLGGFITKDKYGNIPSVPKCK